MHEITTQIGPMFLASTAWFLIISGANAEEFQTPEDVVFSSRLDRTEQRYVVLLPDKFDATVPHDVLLALHGHGSDRWQFITDKRPECQGARDMAARRKMIFVSPDYRAKTSWMGPAAEADLLQILDELHRRFRIRDVVISGGSMGATSALAFAVMHPDCVDGVVALNGTANLLEYENFTDAIAASYGGTKTENARFIKVLHNGQLLHENVEVNAPTRSAAFNDEKPLGPLKIQGDHGPVAFRNLTLKKL